MDPLPVIAQLDAHDALVRACADGRLAFVEFLAAYGDFPRGYEFEEPAAARLLRKRLAFHERVAGLVSGLRLAGQAGSLTGEVADFIPGVGLMRLRGLVARCPRFEMAGDGAEERAER